MVVFLDLDHDGEDDEPGHYPNQPVHSQRGADRLRRVGFAHQLTQVTGTIHNQPGLQPDDSNAQMLAAAVACFPVAEVLASHLDLNDLFALSFTCRKVHDCLVQFAHRLGRQSLRCVNDIAYVSKSSLDENQRATGSLKEAALEDMRTSYVDNGHLAYLSESGGFPQFPRSALGLSGKISRCARDLVGACRRCGIIVCRNCATTSQRKQLVHGRFRRLCNTCLEYPIWGHLDPLQDNHDSHESPPTSSASSARSFASVSNVSTLPPVADSEGLREHRSFTAPAFLRTPCECASRGTFLCKGCGNNLASANTTYQRVWTWRSRYSTHIGGGLGTGLGQGEQGQKCGRGQYCFEKGAAAVCWVEIDCSESNPYPLLGSDLISRQPGTAWFGSEHEPGPPRNKPGYLSQEIEGIGGVVKKKVKKRVKVGATVSEHDDERETSKYLERESSGKDRSWCGWCFRVCPGERDLATIESLGL